jgi:hypothetical protein
VWRQCDIQIKFSNRTLLNEDKLWRTTALIYVDNGKYYTVSRQTPDKEVWPIRIKLMNIKVRKGQFLPLTVLLGSKIG